MINKDKLIGYIAGLTTAVILCSTVTFAQSIEKTITAVYNNIKIFVNGEEVVPKDANGEVVEPFISNGTTYLPVRALANALGQDVTWDGETNSVYIGTVPEKAPEETPVEEKFLLDKDILKAFSDLALIKVGANEVKGSFFNLYITLNAENEYFPLQCDNFSPKETLQTLTIGSEKAAKVLTDDIADMYRELYAVYNAAKKSGFTEKASTKDAIVSQWEQFKGQFATTEEFDAFFLNNSISSDDFKEYLEIFTVYNLYQKSEYDKYASKEYTLNELTAYADKEFVKAKHILVKDEATANDIIKKLKKGTSFDKLVKEYSEDPGQGDDGYTFTKGEMVKPFENAAFALKKNSYTLSPIKTDYGYHIIYRYPIKSEWIKENSAKLSESAAVAAFNKYLETLIESAKISYTQNYEKYISTIK